MIISIDLSGLSLKDCERVIEAAKICFQEDCVDFFLEGTPLEIVDLLVDCGLMKKKSWWKLW